MDGTDGSAACFCNQFFRKTKFCTPLFQKVHFRRYKVTSADTEGFYDGMVQRTVLVEHLSGLFHGTDIVISKIFCDTLHIMKAGVSFGNTVFNEKFNEFCGKMQFIVPEEDHIQIVLVQCASQIFFSDKDQFPDIGFFTERTGVIQRVSWAFAGCCLNKMICDVFSGSTLLLSGILFRIRC